MKRAASGRAAPRRVASALPRAPRREWIVPACVALALAGFVATQYPGALGLPLMTDDYLILGKLHGASFISLWAPVDLLSGFYRPWARELHYWVLVRLFGPLPLPFHLACFVLWFAVMALFFALVQRLAGAAIAALATALAATQAAWGVLLIWPAGSQDLWMMASALLALTAFASGRTGWASAALVVSLLSKEAAATLPVIATLYARVVERRPLVPALRKAAPLWAVAAVWALLHPMIGGRLWHGAAHSAAQVPPHVPWDGMTKLAGSLRQAVNADLVPRPPTGWSQALLAASPAAALLAAAVMVGFRLGGPAEPGPKEAPGSPPTSPRRVAAWGASWALAGWLPLLMPGLGWHPYYALWGGFGVWLAIAIGLARWRALAVVLVIGLSLLRPARAWTPQVDLGSEWYQSRSGALTEAVRADLLSHRPSLPAHSRVFIAGMPGGVGLIPSPGDSPALEVWYGDPTLRGYFASQYTPRAASDTLGHDFFFVFDSTGHSTEIVRGNEDLDRARATPDWLARHMDLASLLVSKGDKAACVEEFEKMTRVFPGNPAPLFALGACRESMGDLEGARACYRKALTLPGATEEMMRIARRDWILP